MINQAGCDASNMFDEEDPNGEFSDDDAEKEFRKARKQKQKAKHLEDGEIQPLAG